MASDACPCGSGLTYAQCCERYHLGASVPTAEALMRSRYSAFATHDASYLWKTWASDHRPSLQEIGFSDEYRSLRILKTTEGGPFHTVGSVEFIAEIRHNGVDVSQHELSYFARDDEGRWKYLRGL